MKTKIFFDCTHTWSGWAGCSGLHMGRVMFLATSPLETSTGTHIVILSWFHTYISVSYSDMCNAFCIYFCSVDPKDKIHQYSHSVKVIWPCYFPYLLSSVNYKLKFNNSSIHQMVQHAKSRSKCFSFTIPFMPLQSPTMYAVILLGLNSKMLTYSSSHTVGSELIVLEWVPPSHETCDLYGSLPKWKRMLVRQLFNREDRWQMTTSLMTISDLL